ncbi:MAG TPA: NAD(P)/FAD-dependent oxidoreductase [Fimbriimonas sp.]
MEGTLTSVVVVGGGAAGILAAWRAASLGARVTLLEKTPRLGTKILISGGGKCNITHDGPVQELLHAFRPNEARFLKPACYRFKNTDILDLLESQGLEVYTRPDGRVFPTSGNAKDVVRILRKHLDEAGVEVRLECPVQGLIARDGRLEGVRTVGSEVACSRIIVSVGGSSYPNSGTTGDGWRWARDLGHTIVPVRAALAPIYLREPRPEWSGVALRNCLLRARHGKEIARWQGDLLFTHHGVSGPCALGISREVVERMPHGEVSLEVDIIPDEPFEVVSRRLTDMAASNPRRLVSSFIEELLPGRLLDGVLASAEVGRDLTGARLDKKSRNRLVSTLKAWSLGDVRHVPLEKGEVVAGGVSLDEVDLHSMRSRLVEGLWLCGEVLDIAGPVGGYNLQAAFSTGYVAGESAAAVPRG